MASTRPREPLRVLEAAEVEIGEPSFARRRAGQHDGEREHEPDDERGREHREAVQVEEVPGKSAARGERDVAADHDREHEQAVQAIAEASPGRVET